MKECRLQQKELAEVLEVSIDRVKSLTSGKVKKLTREESDALVKKLKVRAEYLLDGDGPMFQDETQDQFIDRMQAIKATGLIVDALGLSERDRDGLKDSLTGDPAKDGPLIAQTLARQQARTPQRVIASYGPPPVISHGFHEPEPGTPLVGPDEALLVARYRASPKVLREAVLRMLAPNVDLPAALPLDNVIGKC